jgi:hypothetical protein
MVHSPINTKVILQTVTTSLNDVETSSWIENLLFGNIPEGGFDERLGIIIELSWPLGRKMCDCGDRYKT